MAKAGYRGRKVGGRAFKGKRIGIVYDGQVTEDMYFRGWQQVLAQGRLKIFPAYVRSGGNPRVAVKAAILARRLDSDLHQMWCVSDVDNASPQDVTAAIAEAKKEGINLCLSNRCFEVWLFCHFGRSTKVLTCEADAIALLQGCLDGYSARDKSLNFSALLGRTTTALENSEWLRQQGMRNPSTDVDKLVAVLAAGL